ncbi:MAG TPA: TMEM165/GDT1 family protein [Gemmatimonadaceae bacterium]|nr:TMEM165/GDT1 family protein [Gemmatimonadaceae bacterium]
MIALVLTSGPTVAVGALTLVGTVYVTVLTAELVGDKMVLTAAALTARAGPFPVLAGLIPAQLGKMTAAVLAGGFLSRLPAAAIALLSAVTFIATAIALWRSDNEGRISPVIATRQSSSVRTALVAFSSVFFSEWGDAGQIVVAALVARYGMPLLVCGAATAALASKGVLAVTLGATLRQQLPRRTVRVGAAAMCAVLAVVSAIGVR